MGELAQELLDDTYQEHNAEYCDLEDQIYRLIPEEKRDEYNRLKAERDNARYEMIWLEENNTLAVAVWAARWHLPEQVG